MYVITFPPRKNAFDNKSITFNHMCLTVWIVCRRISLSELLNGMMDLFVSWLQWDCV